MKLPLGVSLLPSGQYRWRIMIDGRTYSGTEPSPALAALRRTEASIDAGGTPDHDPTVRDILDAHIAHAERADTTLSNWRWAYDALPDPFLAREFVDQGAADEPANRDELPGTLHRLGQPPALRSNRVDFAVVRVDPIARLESHARSFKM